MKNPFDKNINFIFSDQFYYAHSWRVYAKGQYLLKKEKLHVIENFKPFSW